MYRAENVRREISFTQNDRKTINIAPNSKNNSSRSRQKLSRRALSRRRSFPFHPRKKAVFIECMPRSSDDASFSDHFSFRAEPRDGKYTYTYHHIHSPQIDGPASGARWSIFPAALNCICVVSYGREYLPEIRILQGTIPFCTYATGNESIRLEDSNP